MKNVWCAVVFGLFLQVPQTITAQLTDSKPRTIVTTDGEIDDVDSFIRMLLCSNEFHIEVWCHVAL